MNEKIKELKKQLKYEVSEFLLEEFKAILNEDPDQAIVVSITEFNQYNDEYFSSTERSEVACAVLVDKELAWKAIGHVEAWTELEAALEKRWELNKVEDEDLKNTIFFLSELSYGVLGYNESRVDHSPRLDKLFKGNPNIQADFLDLFLKRKDENLAVFFFYNEKNEFEQRIVCMEDIFSAINGGW